MDTWRAVKCVDHQTGIVGKSCQARCLCRSRSFNARVVAEARAGLRRLSEAEFACGNRFDSIRREQLAHLAQFAWIVGRDQEAALNAPMRLRLIHRESQSHALLEETVMFVEFDGGFVF